VEAAEPFSNTNLLLVSDRTVLTMAVQVSSQF
jgi:hypothetical protein